MHTPRTIIIANYIIIINVTMQMQTHTVYKYNYHIILSKFIIKVKLKNLTII